MKQANYFFALMLMLCAGSASFVRAGDDAKKHMREGDFCYSRGQYACAISEYSEAVRLAPDDPRAHLYLGDALYQNFESERALPEYKEALRLKPDYAEAHYGLGNALDGIGNTQAAIAEYREAVRMKHGLAHGHEKFVHDALGNTLFRAGDLDGAIAELREAVRVSGNWGRGKQDLCTVLRVRGDLRGTIQECKGGRLVEDRLYAGMALRDTGDLAGAVKVFRDLLPYSTGGSPPEYRSPDELGVTLLEQGDVDGAIAEHRAALLMDPDYARAHYHLGLALQKKGDLAGAVAEYQRALALNETHPPDVEFLGYSPRAIAAMRQAGIFEPELAEARISLGQALESRGDSAGATEQYKTALEHAQRAVEHTQSRRWDYLEILAEAYFVNHKFSDALAAEQKAGALCPDLHHLKERIEKYTKAAGGAPN